MQNISIHMLIDNIQAKNFVKFDSMKIKIHLAWVANSTVIFSASYFDQISMLLNEDFGIIAVRPCVWRFFPRFWFGFGIPQNLSSSL